MKANELRIGNLIYCNDVKCKVEAISNEYVSVSGYEKNKYTPFKIKDVRKVLLTEKWLQDFGLCIHLDKSASIGENPVNFDYALYLKFSETNNCWFYKTINCEIKYVHELQNLYFAITRVELKLIP